MIYICVRVLEGKLMLRTFKQRSPGDFVDHEILNKGISILFSPLNKDDTGALEARGRQGLENLKDVK